MTARKIAVGIGLLKYTRKACSSTRPAMPTGMVARMIIHASRWSAVAIRRSRTELMKPPTRRTQSRQKYTIRAAAVATCSPTMNAR